LGTKIYPKVGPAHARAEFHPDCAFAAPISS
jgi:hypothetical protein